MNTLEYLAAVKQRLGVDSDYALSKELGVAKQTISNYRNGKTHLDDDVCVRVGEILGKHPGLIMLDMHRERAKTPETRAVWATLSEKFSMGFDYLVTCATPRRIRLSA